MRRQISPSGFRKGGLLVLFLFLSPFLGAGDEIQGADLTSHLPAVGQEGVVRIVRLDTDFDGVEDCVVAYNKEGTKVWEAQDYNKDGKMDDLYFFHEGLLVRQEVDSNFDGKIDLWCQIERGLYMISYEQDTDFDGVADKKKFFNS